MTTSNDHVMNPQLDLVLERTVDVPRHMQMGFHEGWGKALDQLVALVGGKKS